MPQAALPSNRGRLRQWLSNSRNSTHNRRGSSATSNSQRNSPSQLNAASLTSSHAPSSPSSPPATSAAPNAPSGLPVAPSSNLHFVTSTLSRQDFKDRVFLRLSQLDQDTIRQNTVSNAKDVDAVVQQALAATKKKQATCQSKRWTFKLRGHTVVLREEADKVVKWLDRFKQVGDVASNADPVHIGLPWAGIRVLLEVGITEPTSNITMSYISVSY